MGDDGWTGFEGVTRFGAVDATLRRINQKQRDDPRIARVVIVVADTVRNRRAMALGVATIRADYPLDSRAVIAALSAGRPPPLNGVVLQRIPADSDRPQHAGHPQAVHTRGKVVDATAAEVARFVDNPVGLTGRGP